jgi:hypothetical protein
MKLGLDDVPQMPKGFEKYQGFKLIDFAAASPLLLRSAILKGKWELKDEAKEVLFGNNKHKIKTSKHFSR